MLKRDEKLDIAKNNMAENTEVGLLFSVDIDASDTLKQLAELKQTAEGLKKEQTEVAKTSGKASEEYIRLGQQIKAVNTEAAKREKQIQADIRLQNAQQGSLDQMRASLSKMVAEYGALSEDQRKNTIEGQRLGQQIGETTAALKTEEEALGDHRRSVGDYGKATVSLRSELRTLVQTLAELKVAGQDNSAEYKAMVTRLAELRDAMGDVSQQANLLASDTRGFDTLMEGARAVTASYGLWKTATQALGVENENLEKSMQSMMVVMGALQSLTELQNLAQKQSNLYRVASNLLQKVGIVQSTAEAKAIAAKTAMQNADSIATKAAAAATWLWNAALSANPVMLVVAAIALLVGGITLLTRGMGKNVSAQKEFERTSKSVEKAIREIEAALRNELSAIDLNTRKLLLSAKERGAAASELAAIELDGIKRVASATKIAAEGEIAGLKKLRDAELKTAKNQKEAAAINAGYTQQIMEQQSIIADAALNVEEKTHETTEVIKQESADAAKAMEDAAKAGTDAAKAAAEEIYNAAVKRSELSQRLAEAQLKAESDASDASDESIKNRLTYEAELFRIQQDGARERLELQRQSGKITADEYKAELSIMAAAQKEFTNRQVGALNDFFESEREAIIGMIEKTVDEEIAEVESTYADAISRLAETQIAETEAAQLEMANLIIRLEEQKAAKIKEIRDAAANDAREKALDDIGSTLRVELLLAGDNAKKRYDAKKKALDAELAVAGDNAAAIADINARMAENERELLDARISGVMEWRDTIVEVYDRIRALTSANADAELQKVAETYDKEKQALADKHAQGLMTEAQYNAAQIKLDQKRVKDEAKIKRDEAIRERVGKVFSVVTDTAVAITKSIVASPVTFGLPWSAYAAAEGALQLATILKEPLPKAARGGLITGPSHRAGGTVIEAEGGEAVMTRRSVSMFGPVLSALNELGGGVPFAGPLSDGGYTLRSASGGWGPSADEIADAFKAVKIVTTVEDINRGQEKYAQIQSRGSLFG